ncbi:MAG: hypothetical protein WC374_04095 [Phycisphaerae bacterium]
MAISKSERPAYLKWYLIVVYVAVPVISALFFLTDIFETNGTGGVPQIVWAAGGIVLLLTVIVTLWKINELTGVLGKNSERIEILTEQQDKNRRMFEQMSQQMCISDTARSILFGENDAAAIRQAVLNLMQNQQQAQAMKIIDRLQSTDRYHGLAGQLRAEVETFQSPEEREKENQIIDNIETLFKHYKWPKASTEIENFIEAFPHSQRAKQLRQTLVDRKEERKKDLLKLWDEAVRKQATERSLEILRELDMYLTPNEGLALQEAARDVFRNKLHNMGVQFSLAVSEKQWKTALDTGRQIVSEFPNSKMAQEIRERLDVLEQRVNEMQQPMGKIES